MNNPKDSDGEIIISRGGEEDDEKSPSRHKSYKTNGKTLHPPIESHWQLPAAGQERKPSSSINSGFKAMLSYPIKIRNSMKKVGRSKSIQVILEGARDPKDEQLVQSFRELLFLEGQLPAKHNNYHTLLRYKTILHMRRTFCIHLDIFFLNFDLFLLLVF